MTTLRKNKPLPTKAPRRRRRLVQTIRRELADLQSDPEFMERFLDQRDPLHQRAVNERTALIEQIAADQAVARSDKSHGFIARLLKFFGGNGHKPKFEKTRRKDSR